MSINSSNPMLAAQMVSYAKGQENQNRFSGEEQERKRKEAIEKEQIKQHQQTQQKAASLKKGILA